MPRFLSDAVGRAAVLSHSCSQGVYWRGWINGIKPHVGISCNVLFADWPFFPRLFWSRLPVEKTKVVKCLQVSVTTLWLPCCVFTTRCCKGGRRQRLNVSKRLELNGEQTWYWRNSLSLGWWLLILICCTFSSWFPVLSLHQVHTSLMLLERFPAADSLLWLDRKES